MKGIFTLLICFSITNCFAQIILDEGLEEVELKFMLGKELETKGFSFPNRKIVLKEDGFYPTKAELAEAAFAEWKNENPNVRINSCSFGQGSLVLPRVAIKGPFVEFSGVSAKYSSDFGDIKTE